MADLGKINELNVAVLQARLATLMLAMIHDTHQLPVSKNWLHWPLSGYMPAGRPLPADVPQQSPGGSKRPRTGPPPVKSLEERLAQMEAEIKEIMKPS
jgi:hypothetical protein